MGFKDDLKGLGKDIEADANSMGAGLFVDIGKGLFKGAKKLGGMAKKSMANAKERREVAAEEEELGTGAGPMFCPNCGAKLR